MFHLIFPELCSDHITSYWSMALAFGRVNEYNKMETKSAEATFLKVKDNLFIKYVTERAHQNIFLAGY